MLLSYSHLPEANLIKLLHKYVNQTAGRVVRMGFLLFWHETNDTHRLAAKRCLMAANHNELNSSNHKLRNVDTLQSQLSTLPTRII